MRPDLLSWIRRISLLPPAAPRGRAPRAQQVEMPLDHRGRVADLVRDAGGELADRGELLSSPGGAARHAALRWRGGVGGALGDLRSSEALSACSSARWRGLLFEQTVGRGGQAAELVAGWRRRRHAHARRRRSMRPMVACMRSIGRKMPRAQNSVSSAHRQSPAARRATTNRAARLAARNGPRGKPTCEHADAFAAAVHHQLVADACRR